MKCDLRLTPDLRDFSFSGNGGPRKELIRSRGRRKEGRVFIKDGYSFHFIYSFGPSVRCIIAADLCPAMRGNSLRVPQLHAHTT